MVMFNCPGYDIAKERLHDIFAYGVKPFTSPHEMSQIAIEG